MCERCTKTGQQLCYDVELVSPRNQKRSNCAYLMFNPDTGKWNLITHSTPYTDWHGELGFIICTTIEVTNCPWCGRYLPEPAKIPEKVEYNDIECEQEDYL